MNDELLSLSHQLVGDLRKRTREIDEVTGSIRLLSVNALIEAAHAGKSGAGFAVVAHEVSEVSERIDVVIDDLHEELDRWVEKLERAGNAILIEARCARLNDLALNAIELIDRNLYERSCDVRWWATDSAVVDCCGATRSADGASAAEAARHCSQRLGVILDAYTVYSDIWVCGLDGRVLATGRPEKFPLAVTANVASDAWFAQAMRTATGGEYAVANVARCPELGGRTVATYAAAVRKGGTADGDIIGVVGIFFDWQAQSQAVMDGLRLSAEERTRTRSLLLDANFRVIAASDQSGVLSETFPLKTEGKTSGSYCDKRGNLVGFSLTPGYETYRGLGWYGVVVQTPPERGTTGNH